jgi:hypothetical protein
MIIKIYQQLACTLILAVTIVYSSSAHCADLNRLWVDHMEMEYTTGTHTLLSDNNGGSIAVWSTQNYPLQTRAQRYDSSGNALWGTNGKLVSDEASAQGNAAVESVWGGIIAVWYSENKLYAQRLDANGNKMWNDGNGVIVFDPIPGGPLSVCSDGIGGAYISKGLMVNQILDDGQVPSGVSGVQIGNGNLSIISDNQGRLLPLPTVRGGIFAVWYELGPAEIRAQHIKAGLQWGNNGALVASSGSDIGDAESWKTSLVNDGAGGLIVAWKAWYGDITTGHGELRTQRLNAAGERLWGNDGTIVLNTDTVGGDTDRWSDFLALPKATSDGNHGVILSWLDVRTISSHRVYCQRVGENGESQWTPNGIWIRMPAEESSVQPIVASALSIASDGLGGCIIVYTSGFVWLHRVDENGVTIGQQGVSFVDIYTPAQETPRLVFDSTGPSPKGAIISWSETPGGTFGQKIEISQVPPDNDSIDIASSLGLPADPARRLYGSIYWATNDGSASCGQTDQPDLWYLFTAPSDGTLRVDTCGTNDLFSTDGGLDTTLSIYGYSGSLIELQCNDNAPVRACGGADSGQYLDSLITQELVSGQSVLVRLSRHDDSTNGMYALNWRFLTNDTPADLDLDGDIDGFDLSILVDNFGCDSGCTASLDDDDDVDSDDLNIFADYFGRVNQ